MKNEIKNILLEMISEIGINDASVTELCDTAEQMNEIAMREYRKLFN